MRRDDARITIIIIRLIIIVIIIINYKLRAQQTSSRIASGSHSKENH